MPFFIPTFLTLLLTLLLTTTTATTLPTSDHAITASITCTPAPPFYLPDTRPTAADCNSAILALPSSAHPGTFRHTGAEPGFKLPVRRSYGTCTVTVRLREASEWDRASWRGIRYSALWVAETCEGRGRLGGRMTGGWRRMGIANMIVVEVGRGLGVGMEGVGNFSLGMGGLEVGGEV